MMSDSPSGYRTFKEYQSRCQKKNLIFFTSGKKKFKPEPPSAKRSAPPHHSTSITEKRTKELENDFDGFFNFRRSRSIIMSTRDDEIESSLAILKLQFTRIRL